MSFIDKKIDGLNKLGEERLLTDGGSSEER